MGTEQSKSDRDKFSKEEVERMLERQRRLLEQQQIEKAIKESTAAQQARFIADAQQAMLNAAQQASLERDWLQPQQIDQAVKESTPPAQQARVKAAQACYERDRTPYSFSQNDIQIGVAQPTKTSLYPNLGTTASAAPPSYSYTYSPNGPVNNSPLNNLQNTVKHNSPTTPTAPRAPAAVPRQRFRDRSTSRPRSQNRSDSNDELNCLTCHQKYTLNIYQCDSGHSSCSNCKDRYMCGKCGCPIGNMRNRSLESYIAERKVSCPNSQDGCQLVFKMAELEAHQKECPFKEMMCPLAAIFGQCRWRGKLPQISKHFEEAHPIHCTAEVNRELTVTQTQQQIVYLVVIGSFNFLFNLRVSETDRKVYLTVQLIGTKHSAEKWSYEVHVYNKNQPRRKYQYTDICHSNSTSLDEIFSTEQCATLPFAYADTFVNRNLLTYKFFIKKDVERRPRNEGQGGVRRRYGKSNCNTSN